MRHLFFCIDGHTAGNPVRLVAGGAPMLRGATMAARRQDFLERFDWIRTGLCFEPRGHDMMSGGFIYPPCRDDTDVGILFIETSGCLPMCGHGSIGMITFGLENGFIKPREPGRLRVETPAGLIEVSYETNGPKVKSVRITNVPSFLEASDIRIDVPGFGPLTVDVAYGGNYYAIVEPQGVYKGLDELGAMRLLQISPIVRELVREQIQPVHPLEPTIKGVSHVLWADAPKSSEASARNAVFYGERAIDRSPCGTGTSARMAHLAARGKLNPGERFVHESYIGSKFIGGIVEQISLAGRDAIVPYIEGAAISTGFNTIWIDSEDPFWRGFQVL
ncbi:MAG: 4-hydroxyproline epimerase [Amphiplicatus sp.]